MAKIVYNMVNEGNKRRKIMIPIVNLNNIVYKELELQHQTHRRTHRWMADAHRFTYESWYRKKPIRISVDRNNLDAVNQVVEIKPHREAHSSILTRLSNLLNTRRQPVGSKG